MSFVLIWKWMTFHCTEHDRSVCPWWITVIERGITIFSGRERENDKDMIITERSITDPISGCPQFFCSNNHLKVLELTEYHRRLYILYSRLVSLSAVVQPTTAPLVLDSPHPQCNAHNFHFTFTDFQEDLLSRLRNINTEEMNRNIPTVSLKFEWGVFQNYIFRFHWKPNVALSSCHNIASSAQLRRKIRHLEPFEESDRTWSNSSILPNPLVLKCPLWTNHKKTFSNILYWDQV